MAQKRIQYVKTSSGIEKQLYASAADIVELDPIEGMTATNVQDAIAELQDIAAQGGVTSVNGKTGAVTLTKVDVGLGNVDNVKQYSASNPPPYPVTSVAGRTGAVTLTKSDVGLGNVTNDAQVKRSEMGSANGVATLDAQGKVPSAQLPSYVDDVLEGTYVNATTFNDPSGQAYTPESGKIYIDTTTNKQYRWGGTEYAEISSSLALGETSSTAYPGDKGKQNADNIAALDGRVDQVESDIDQIQTSLADVVTLSGEQTISGAKTFTKTVTIKGSGERDKGTKLWADPITETLIISTPKDVPAIGDNEVRVPKASGTIALTSDIDALKQDFIDGKVVLGKATTADKLATARTLSLTGDATGSASFDGSANAAIPVTLKNSGVTAGTYSVTQVNAKGIVTAGNQLIEWGTSGQKEPSANLAIGGIFFELVE